MPLSNEDNLRLNILRTQQPKVIRINDSKLSLHALTAKGEATIQLHPNCNEEAYLKLVRETLSLHALGSHKGYPIYLKRWTRMEQQRDVKKSAQLLLLAEPEAVIAVVHTPDISLEIAENAWWAEQNTEVARCLLSQKQVKNTELAKTLMDFLIEFLPFETDALAIVESIRLISRPSDHNATLRDKLWQQAHRKRSYYVGFLHNPACDLPLSLSEHPDYAKFTQLSQANPNNPYLKHWTTLLSSEGQAWLYTLQQAMEKPKQQDVVVSLFDAINRYHHGLHAQMDVDLSQGIRDLDTIEAQVQQWYQQPETLNPAWKNCLDQCDATSASQAQALLFLLQLGEKSLNPILSQTDAVGSVLRKRLQPLFKVIHQHLQAFSAN